MASWKSQELSSFSSSSLNWKYDVFLSFRGDDTRRNFTDHLYATLRQKGVHTFKDDRELERGKNISLDLLQTIRDSRFSIIIFSRNYAASTWCLDELEIIHERMKQGNLTAIPIFYGVDPSDVQMQTGEYGKALAKHVNDYKANPDKVLKWRVAMTEVANVSGWDLQNRHEVEFIQDVVEGILRQLRKLRSNYLKVEEGLIGIDKHLRQVEYLLRESSSNVSVIGICGMGGIGKTTGAKALYDKFSYQFEGSSCFLVNVREMEDKHGLVYLQEQLFSEILSEKGLRIWGSHRDIDEIRSRLRHKKVLIVLDDVDNFEQLKSLAGRSDWFGDGSIIIITTRNEHLLSCYGSYQLYTISPLDTNEALQLFFQKAFRSHCPREGYDDLSYDFVTYCSGLPLAIDVTGSFLYGRSIDEWRSALSRLKKIPSKQILDKLRISFDGLEETEKNIFLDVACFFKGNNQDYVKRILESCGFFLDIGIRVLIEKSLIIIDSHNQVQMHDLLQKMGQEIVRQQSPEEPGKRSRLWLCKDVYHVLSNNTGTESIEGIMINGSYKEEKEWSGVEVLSAKALSKMKRLRLLEVRYIHFSCNIDYLPNSLRYLHWGGYPSKFLPSGFHPYEIVEVHMQNSKVKQLWKATKPLKMLKYINLCHCKELTTAPNFTEIPNLEKLILVGCIKLRELHKSIGDLENLVLLDLKDCKSLTFLPSTIGDLKSLKTLILNGCSSLSALPERLAELTCLESLDLGGIGRGRRSSRKPWDFLLLWRKPVTSVSFTLSNLSYLTELNLSYCHLKEGVLPNDLSCFPLLKELNLSGNDFVSIPTSINRLSELILLYIRDCKDLRSLPECASSVEFFDMSGCISLEDFPEPTFENRRRLRLEIYATNCYKLIQNQPTNSRALVLLANYLQSLKHNGSAHFYASCFYMSIPGHDIPEWFNYQEFDAPLALSPPPYWCNDEWIGFAICGIWDYDPKSRLVSGVCDLLMLIDRSIEDISNLYVDEMPALSDQLWLAFIPLALNKFQKRNIDWWNKVRKIQMICDRNGPKVKRWGLRMVYRQDIEALMQITSEGQRSRTRSKRAREEDFCADGEGCSGNGGSCSSTLEPETCSKRVKTPE